MTFSIKKLLQACQSRDLQQAKLEPLEPRMLFSATLAADDPYSFAGHEHGSGCGCAGCTGSYHDYGVVETEQMLAQDQEYLVAMAQSGPNPAGDPLASLSDTFSLHSRPDANHTIYLDFDGHITQGQNWIAGAGIIDSPAFSLDADRSSFSNDERQLIQRVWQRVAEDFAPFDVNVTTEDPGVEALRKTGAGDTQWGVRVVNTIHWSGATGAGAAHRNSFNSSGDEPVFVFVTGEHLLANTISHEAGHALGLTHDRTTGGEGAGYYKGHGIDGSEEEWAPIMGFSEEANMSTWDNSSFRRAGNTGPSANGGKGPNDLDVITTYNGFGFRADDHGDATASASLMSFLGTNASDPLRSDVEGFGVISEPGDLDFFEFDHGGGAVDLTINSYAAQYYVSDGSGGYDFYQNPVGFDTFGTSNLDVLATIYDSNGSVVATANPSGLSASFTGLSLGSGTYYLSVDGTGFGNWAANPPTGYSDYVSLGQYHVSGTVVTPPADTTSDLVTRWAFNEGSGTTAADTATSGSKVDTGTLANGAAFDSSAGLGGAVVLDGVNDYVDVTNSPDINTSLTTNRTVSAWVYIDDAASTDKQVIFEEGGSGRGTNIYVQSGQLYVGGWDLSNGWSGTHLSTAITSGQWHHVAMTLAGGATIEPDAMHGYLDGVAFGSGDGMQLITRSDNIGIGQTESSTRYHDNTTSGSSSALSGMIDDVRVYNRALTTVDLAALAAVKPADITSDLVTHWTFNEGSGTTAADTAPSGSKADTGTLTNGAAFESTLGLGGALVLDGVDDYVNVPNSPDINTVTVTDRTVSAWVYIDDAASTDKQVIFEEGGSGRGMNIYTQSGQLYVGGWDLGNGWPGTYLSTAITSGQWHHVAVTQAGGPTVEPDAMQGYLNGAAFGSGDGIQHITRSGNIGIGRTSTNGSTRYHDNTTSGLSPLSGAIDDVRVYNRELTAIDLAVLAAATPTAPLAVLNLDGLSTGNHSFTADGEIFNGYVHNDNGTGWLLVGRGREGWEFDDDGQGTLADVGNAATLGTTAAFDPAMYSDDIINDLINNSGIDLTDVEIRIRRAGNTAGTGAYQEARWRPTSQTIWTGDFDAPSSNSSGGYDVEFEILSGLGGPLAAANAKTGDTFRSGPSGNDASRIFTWGWSGHGSEQGFSYGNPVQGINNNDPNTFLWENGAENHAIPYTEVYIRSLAADPVPSSQSLVDLDALSTGNHSFTADGETFDGYVHNDNGTGWLLVGRGREGWEFDNDGQGTIADVGNAATLGTTAAFDPAMYSDDIINDLITNSGIDLTDVEIRIRRAGDTAGTGAYQEARLRPTSLTTWTGDFDAPTNNSSGGYNVEFEILSGLGGPLAEGNTKTGDTLTSGHGANNASRIFTWGWSGHDYEKGFSYGNSIGGLDTNSAFLWEFNNKNHAIPYTEVYIRSLDQSSMAFASTSGQTTESLLVTDPQPSTDSPADARAATMIKSLMAYWWKLNQDSTASDTDAEEADPASSLVGSFLTEFDQTRGSIYLSDES